MMCSRCALRERERARARERASERARARERKVKRKAKRKGTERGGERESAGAGAAHTYPNVHQTYTDAHTLEKPKTAATTSTRVWGAQRRSRRCSSMKRTRRCLFLFLFFSSHAVRG